MTTLISSKSPQPWVDFSPWLQQRHREHHGEESCNSNHSDSIANSERPKWGRLVQEGIFPIHMISVVSSEQNQHHLATGNNKSNLSLLPIKASLPQISTKGRTRCPTNYIQRFIFCPVLQPNLPILPYCHLVSFWHWGHAANLPLTVIRRIWLTLGTNSILLYFESDVG